MHAYLKSLFGPKTASAASIDSTPRPMFPTSEARSLFETLVAEVQVMSFGEAEDIVTLFQAKVGSEKLVRTPVYRPDGGVLRDAGFYSRLNLTRSRGSTAAAFKTYYVLVEDDEAARAAYAVLRRVLAFVVPDHVEEPLYAEDLDALLVDHLAFDCRLALEQPSLAAIRRHAMSSGLGVASRAWPVSVNA